MMSLRKRKVTAPVKEESDFENEKSDDENDSDWSNNDPKKGGRPRKKISPLSKPVPNETLSEYERIRLANIEERNEMLRSMGINVPTEKQQKAHKTVKKETPKPKKIKKEKENTPTPTRISARLKGKPAVYDSFMDENTTPIEEEPDIDTRNLGTQRWKEDELEGRETFLEELKDKIKDIDYSPGSLDLSSCSQACFRDVMLSLNCNSVTKVVMSRIQALCVHPSTSKKIVIAGSKNGSLGIWDVDGRDENCCIELFPNERPINCISVDTYNPNEIYITSHDGTVICCDINTNQFISLYATPYDDRINHLTWHDQLEPNTFLVSHGDGSVFVLDKREKSISKTFKCFDRSCRTVQHYPKDNNYFLASSGALNCGAKIFDLRKGKQICHLEFPKGLTSSFFSHSGINIVTTCNDDSIKVHDSTDINQPQLKVSTPHNNHTGRWLSVFKAQWYPARDDIFHIGSLMNPRRMQMYTDNGKLLTELRNYDLMTTCSPVMAVHKSLPFVVGGNSSGKVHAFVPPEQD